MVQQFEKDILIYSLITRVVYTFLSSSFRLILPKHYPNVFISPLAQSSINVSIYDEIVFFILGGLSNWDAQHFYHIAQNSYTFEQSLAFFPLYPGILSILFKVFSFFIGNTLNSYSKIILASFFFNSVCFSVSAIVLYRLSRIILRNNFLALQAALLFCISPGSIFFLASYTETVYSLLVFSGMLQYAKGNVFLSTIFFALATSCRSNGITNIGFILHFILYELMITAESSSFSRITLITKFCKLALKCLICVSLIICPYIIFQLFGYYAYCVNKKYIEIPRDLINFAVNEGYKMPTDNITWCNNTLPFPYPFVQSHYWNVGFLKYYTYKQIPNFLLALPIVLIIVSYSYVFLKCYRQLLFQIKFIYNLNLKLKMKLPSNSMYFLPRSTFVFVVHAFVLTIFCLLNINVQVTTRLICSSSPLLYWISTMYFKRIFRTNKIKTKRSLFNVICCGLQPVNKTGSFLCLYFLCYTFIGIALFSCNYPWT